MNIFRKYTTRTLIKNRTRTIVTIIGIILSAAMITAVTTLISTLQQFVIDTVTNNNGSWHAQALGVSQSDAGKLSGNKAVDRYSLYQDVGYSPLQKIENKDKPYLFVAGIGKDFDKLASVRLTDGRMPQNSRELILPENLLSDGAGAQKMGDTLTLQLGDRVTSDGSLLTQATNLKKGDAAGETLKIRESRTYQIVGFYERPGFEDFEAPGYTALTVDDGNPQYKYDAFIQLKKPKQIYNFIKANFPSAAVLYNKDLLRLTGSSNDISYNKTLYSMAAILIAIIMIASISLIYNAFAISVSERTKQFGLLSSIGATKKQLTSIVLHEALTLSAIGIPLGLLAGMAGISVTLGLLAKSFLLLYNGGTRSGAVLHFTVSAASIIAAVVLGLITILISAYLPAQRALRVSAIDAIRQTSDIKINPRRVKTSKLTLRLFGFEGMVASKNFKRNRRKYRATIFSLVVSVVLFISASSFCTYASQSANSLIDDNNFDLAYLFSPKSSENSGSVNPSVSDIYRTLSSAEGITKGSYNDLVLTDIDVDSSDVSKDYLSFIAKDSDRPQPQNGKVKFSASYMCFVEDKTYEAYLKENNLPADTYMNASNPTALALDFYKQYSHGKYYTFNVLGNKSASVQVQGKTLKIGATVSQPPFGMMNERRLALIYPYSAADSVLGGMQFKAENSGVCFAFNAGDHKAAYNAMLAKLRDMKLSTNSLVDYAGDVELNRAMIGIVRVFSYGFIILISLIAVANVFNTISTNISLRRRELATLRSVGMTPKGFRKMMSCECLLYGLKALVLGLPLSVLATFLIYKAIQNGWEVHFFLPWVSVAIAVLSVFAVVFATMIYSMSKLKKENTVDALKNENI